ncbi:nucleotidyltransferase domain-containing protein [Parasphaerochaeta coccoides]|uniref:Polymerase nucleotidyl transferase domain-containing protein n=1 Tax=Parasphaerochaeta coccoides (strain ATCC BAA-1237 / DSM 17374 / SPN1) TaxID=760011 RepID=F4GID7_PARC1|nr:nucleotidyltransferase domain-containing protein [Parasphaerochaeta coccoides]AEC01645.1 hypothetical protein Spico_0416 [Parasphaerochaeta coccoides DSM 17374]
MKKELIIKGIENYICQKLNENIESEDIVLWIGSTANGLSNSYSDIDLLLITASPDYKTYTAFDGETYLISEIHNDLRFDVEIIDKGKLLNIIGRVNSVQDLMKFHDLILSESELDLLCNVLNAICIRNKDGYLRLRDKISLDRLCECIKNRYQGRFYNELEDMRGFISEKQFYNISYMTFRMIVSFLLVLLSHFRIAFIKEKWLLNYVMRKIPTTQFDLDSVKELYSYCIDPSNPNMDTINNFLFRITNLMNILA